MVKKLHLKSHSHAILDVLDHEEIASSACILLSSAMAPAHLHEPYITHGYRPEMNFKQTFQTLFRIHNQTGNIWSHILPLMIFIYRFYRYIEIAWYLEEYTVFMDIAAIVAFYLSAILCLCASVFFHLCSCSPEEHYHMLYNCDVVGILGLVLGSYLPGLYFAFRCQPFIRGIYLFIILSAVTAIAILINTPSFRNNRRYKTIKLTLFISVIAWAVIPAAHWIFTASVIHVHLLLYRLIAMLLLYGIGFLFYVTKFPECESPGSFNYWGHSHQWWHVCVASAALVWEANMLDAFVYSTSHTCEW